MTSPVPAQVPLVLLVADELPALGQTGIEGGTRTGIVTPSKVPFKDK